MSINLDLLQPNIKKKKKKKKKKNLDFDNDIVMKKIGIKVKKQKHNLTIITFR